MKTRTRSAKPANKMRDPAPHVPIYKLTGTMTAKEATDTAVRLLHTYGNQGFEISMSDQSECDLMRAAFGRLGRETEPNEEPFQIKVSPD